MHRVFLVVFLCASALVATLETRAEDGSEASADSVVAHVGSGRVITARELEERIAALPVFQRVTLGATPDAVRHKMLSDVLVRDALLTVAAEAQRLADDPSVAYELDRARSNATVRAIRSSIGPAAAIGMQDVEKYYEENRARYDTPERYQLWRILCETRETALMVLDLAKKDPSVKNFGDLAREHSIDKATRLRAGNLGFLTAEGSSNEPGLRADPAIVRAAQSVRDGELVSAPVPEGAYFAVVWRRGTVAATKHPVEAVAAQIRDALWKRRIKEHTDQLLASLRATRLRDLDESPLQSLILPNDDPAVSSVR